MAAVLYERALENIGQGQFICAWLGSGQTHITHLESSYADLLRYIKHCYSSHCDVQAQLFAHRSTHAEEISSRGACPSRARIDALMRRLPSCDE